MNDCITHFSEDYKKAYNLAEEALASIDELIAEHRPSICREVYLTGDEVMTMFNISPRTLQNYRDERIIPYTTIGGKFLYPQASIFEILERNFRKALK